MTGKTLWQKIVKIKLQKTPESKKIYKLIRDYQNIDIPTENLKKIDEYLSKIIQKINSNSDHVEDKSKKERSTTLDSSTFQNRIEKIENKLDLILEALDIEDVQQASSSENKVSPAVAPKPKENQEIREKTKNTRKTDMTQNPKALERLRTKLKTLKASQ